jgi:hypothetical protein
MGGTIALRTREPAGRRRPRGQDQRQRLGGSCRCGAAYLRTARQRRATVDVDSWRRSGRRRPRELRPSAGDAPVTACAGPFVFQDADGCRSRLTRRQARPPHGLRAGARRAGVSRPRARSRSALTVAGAERARHAPDFNPALTAARPHARRHAVHASDDAQDGDAGRARSRTTSGAARRRHRDGRPAPRRLPASSCAEPAAPAARGRLRGRSWAGATSWCARRTTGCCQTPPNENLLLSNSEAAGRASRHECVRAALGGAYPG